MPTREQLRSRLGTSAGTTQLDRDLAVLRKYGYGLPEKKKKLPVLSRLGLVLNAASPTTAAYRSLYEGKNFAGEYAKNLGQSLYSGLTGTDIGLEPTQRTSKDILVKEGMVDRPGKIDAADVLGFGLDVVTDPTTYLTAGTAKGGAKIFGEGGKAIQLMHRIS